MHLNKITFGLHLTVCLSLAGRLRQRPSPAQLDSHNPTVGKHCKSILLIKRNENDAGRRSGATESKSKENRKVRGKSAECLEKVEEQEIDQVPNLSKVISFQLTKRKFVFA